MIGAYNFENALAAVCVGNNFGISACSIKEAIESYVPDNSRSQLVKTDKGNSLLLDCYNANPSSMETSIENFAKIDLPNKVLIIGDMLELGDATGREHGVIIGLVKKLGFEKVYFVGRNFCNIKEAHDFRCFYDSDDCAKHLSEEKLSNASILIKGSHGMKMDKIVPYV